jgi:hypothetical protein
MRSALLQVGLTGCFTGLCAVIGIACGGGEAATTATLVSPTFGDQCLDFGCSGQGVCVARDAALGPTCECAPGYAGKQCETCGAGFHRDAKDHCVPDKRCADQATDPCGIHGDCNDDSGVVACVCERGYEGARCTLCIPGYEADEFGDCLQKVRSDGRTVVVPATCVADACHGHGQCHDLAGLIECDCYPGYEGGRCDACANGYNRPVGIDRCVPSASCNASSCGGCVVFDGGRSFPNHPDTCNSSKTLDLDGMTFSSLGGDGTIWLCAPSSRYGLMTEHVAVEAGMLGAARVTFGAPIVKLSFDYVAWDALSLEVLADDKRVHLLEASRYEQGAVTLSFDKPVSVLGFRSTDTYAHALALDNLVYESEPAHCP